jgi:serine/threonine protein kinase
VEPGQPPTDKAAAATLQAGQIVAGTYRIERLIGKGGMAEVWEATNQRTGKRVALKAFSETSAEAPGGWVLRREALAAARINHPNVVNIYDVVEHAGATCIVMEILDGEPLAAYLARKGFLGLEEAAALLLPAMRGVAAANAMGVVHRDLKPKNIFICVGADGRMLTTKVVDFGISVVREQALGALAVGDAPPMLGTPAYMSPEHIQGLADIDARADVYGFGVLFFETLTGQLPFLGDPGPELMARILRDLPPRLSVFRPDLDESMVSVVERALAKERKDRFPSLDDFIAAVEELTLPASALPRALTPLAGVPVFALSEPRSGAHVASGPVVTAAATPEPTDTRRLYSLSRPEPESEVGPRPRVEPSSPATDPSATARPDPPLRGTWAHSAVGVVLFAGAFLLVAWLAFPWLLRPVPDPNGEPVAGPRPEAPASRRTAFDADG